MGVVFFQAEDGIRDVERSRGLGDVYKRQKEFRVNYLIFVLCYILFPKKYLGLCLKEILGPEKKGNMGPSL